LRKFVKYVGGHDKSYSILMRLSRRENVMGMSATYFKKRGIEGVLPHIPKLPPENVINIRFI